MLFRSYALWGHVLFYKDKLKVYWGLMPYARKYELVAVSEGREGHSIRLRERNRFFRGQEVDVLQPGREPFTATLDQIYNQDWEPIEAAPHAEMVVHWKTDLDVAPGAYLRVKKEPRSE